MRNSGSSTLPALLRGLILGAILLVSRAHGVDRYVALGGAHQEPFTNWYAAATTLQAAVNVSTDGDTIWVSNGIYDIAGEVSPDGLTNRVFLPRAVVLVGCGGPSNCIIVGGPLTRCCYLVQGARLSGFTLQGGQAGGATEQGRQGGGAWCESGAVISNCILLSNSAGCGGGVFGGTLVGCILKGNHADHGGGAAGSVLSNCWVEGNSSDGVFDTEVYESVIISNSSTGCISSRVYRSRIAYNRAGYYDDSRGVWKCYVEDSIIEGNHDDRYYGGAGAADSELVRTRIVGNGARYRGGGAVRCRLWNCMVISNCAGSVGGGVVECILYNTLVAGNSARWGGGCYKSTSICCTVVGNEAEDDAGFYEGVAVNTISWRNRAAHWDSNFSSAILSHCNDGDPGIASVWNPILLASSPCIDAGTNQPWMTGGQDLAGQPRIRGGRVDIGAYEFYPQLRTGELEVAVQHTPFAAVTGIQFTLEGAIKGAALDCSWDFGDGAVVTGRSTATHAYKDRGEYSAVLHVWNCDGTIAATTRVYVFGPDIYVATSGNDTNPGGTWISPKRTIQAAIDAAWPGCERVLVSNGVYDSGGRAGPAGLTNRVYIDRPIRLESVNGPKHTIILGRRAHTDSGFGPDAVRGIYAATQCWISGFTIYGGHTHTTAVFYCRPAYGPCSAGCRVVDPSPWSGGGIWCHGTNVEVVDCMFLLNRAYSRGGAARSGRFSNCRFWRNEAACLYNEGDAGGACFESYVSNCTFVENWAIRGGALAGGVAESCNFLRNSARIGGAIAGGKAYGCLFVSNRAECVGGAMGTRLIGNFSNCRSGWWWEQGTRAINCIFRGNRAGGGAVGIKSFLNRCVIKGHDAGDYGLFISADTTNSLIVHNRADRYLLGAYSTFENCTIVGNISPPDTPIGYLLRIYNSVIVSNSPFTSEGYLILSNCCVLGYDPGPGNISADPLFVDYAAGDFHLRPDSPCINRGENQEWMVQEADLDGNPRIQCGRVDIGAYESPYWGKYSDVDGDGISDFNEFHIAGTDPTNSRSVFALQGTPRSVHSDGEGRAVILTWPSKPGRVYRILRGTNLVAGDFEVIRDAVAAQGATTSITDHPPSTLRSAFYRILVRKSR